MAKIKADEEFFAVIDSLAISGAKLDTLEARREEERVALLAAWGAKIDKIRKPHNAEFRRAKSYVLANRDRLLGRAQSAKTNVASWGFKANPASVIPVVKITDAAMVEQLLALPERRGMEYLHATYKLDKSKIADAIGKGVGWVKKLFHLTQTEQFFVNKIKDNMEGTRNDLQNH